MRIPLALAQHKRRNRGSKVCKIAALFLLLVLLSLSRMLLPTTQTNSSSPLEPEWPLLLQKNNNEDEVVLNLPPLTRVDCVPPFSFLMHQTDMVQLMCEHEEERRVTTVMTHIFVRYQKQIQNKTNTSSSFRMVDVGANTGFFSFLAAAVGHDAIQFDLQTRCVQLLTSAARANGFSNQDDSNTNSANNNNNNHAKKNNRLPSVQTWPHGVSSEPSEMWVPDDTECEGTFPLTTKRKTNNNNSSTLVTLNTLDYFLLDNNDNNISTNHREDNNNIIIIMLKVDTEGNEQRVLQGAQRLFQTQAIRNAIVEVTPGYQFWNKSGITPKQVHQTFGRVADCGYWMISLHDFSVHRTAAEVIAYLQSNPFRQSNVWWTMEPHIFAQFPKTSHLSLTLLKEGD